MKRLSVLFLVAASAASSSRVHAVEPTSADSAARAQALFDQALTAARKNDFKAACPLFRASQVADPKTSTLINLGTCYERNFQIASAWAAFREAEVSARRAGLADLEEQAHRKAAQIEPSVMRLTIDVPAASRVPGLVIERDGAVVQPTEWQNALPVDPGEHVVSAAAPSRKAWNVHTFVGNESRKVVVPVLQPGGGFWTAPRKVGVAVAAVGVAAVGAGLVAALISKSNYETARGTCAGPGPTNCDAGAAADERSARSLATAATALIIPGAIVAAGGVALVAFGGPHKAAKPKDTALVLHGSPTWLGVSGRF